MKRMLIAGLLLAGCSGDEWCAKYDFVGETYAKCYKEKAECEEWLEAVEPEGKELLSGEPPAVTGIVQCMEADKTKWYMSFK